MNDIDAQNQITVTGGVFNNIDLTGTSGSSFTKSTINGTVDLNNNENGARPLADKMRPSNLDEFIGQRHIVAEGSLLRRAIKLDRLDAEIAYSNLQDSDPAVMKVADDSIIRTIALCAGTAAYVYLQVIALLLEYVNLPTAQPPPTTATISLCSPSKPVTS